MKRIVLLLVFILASVFAANAEHIAGASISYRNIGDNRYEVTLTYYRDCSSPTLANTQELISIRRGATGPYEDSLVLNRVNERPIDIGNICARLASSTKCNSGGTINSVERYRYRGTITLPDRDRAWIFSWINCLRSTQLSQVITAPTPGQNCIYVEALLDNFAGDNSSPTFTSDPFIYTCSTRQAILNNNAQDPDGDRITYQLVPVQYAPNSDFTYNTAGGFSPSNPINGANFVINSRGLISIQSGAPGVYPYSVVARAFDGSRVVNVVRRDILIVVEDCNNTPPAIEDAVGDGVFHGDTIVWNAPYREQSFTLNSSDVDALQFTRIIAPTGLSSILSGAIINEVPGRNPGERGLITITWFPTRADARTYNLTFTVKDGSCPREGITTRSIVLIVQKPYVIQTPPYALQKCDRFINLGASVSNGTRPYTFSWTNYQGTRDNIVNPDSMVARTNKLGCYIMRVTDHWGQTGITDSVCIIKPYSGVITQDQTCNGPTATPPCPYKICTNVQTNFRHTITLPRNVIGTDYTWSFLRDDSTNIYDTLRGNPVDYTWRKRGALKYSVTFKIDSCYYTDYADITVCRKPDLKIKILDSCNADKYYILNEGIPQRSGCGMKYESTITYPENIGTAQNPIIVLRTLADAGNVTGAGDTVRFNAGSVVGNRIFLRLKLLNDCGDSTLIDTLRLFSRPILFPNPIDTLYLTACPTIIRPKVVSGKGPYTYFFDRADEGYRSNYLDSSRLDSVRYPKLNFPNKPYPFTKIGNLSDRFGGDTLFKYNTRYSRYFASVTDSVGCSYIKPFTIVRAVQAGFLFSQACTGNSFGIVVDTVGAIPVNYNKMYTPDTTAIVPGSVGQVYWSWGDGTIDTIPFGRPIVKDTHVYAATGTYTIKLLVKNDSGCVDTAKKDIYIETSRPVPYLEDSTLCFQRRLGGVNVYDLLNVYGGISPGVFKWKLIRDITDTTTYTQLFYTPTTDGRLEAQYYSGGKKKALLITEYTNGCLFRDTFNVTVGENVQFNPYFAARPCAAVDSFDVVANLDSLDMPRVKSARWDMGDGNVIIGKTVFRYAYPDGLPRKIKVSVIDTLGCAYPYDAPKEFDYFPAISVRPCVNDFSNILCKNVPSRFYIPARCRAGENVGNIAWSVRGPQNIDTVSRDTAFTRSFSLTGVYNLRFTVFTSDGTCSASDSVRFIISDEAKVSVAINTPCERMPSIFDFSASRPSSFSDTILKYSITTIPDGEVFESTTPIITRVWPIRDSSDYRPKVIARITTSSGCIGEDTIQFRVRARPIAGYSSTPSPAEVRAGDTITFTTFKGLDLSPGSYSTPVKGNLLNAKWDFGDTTTGKNRIITKVYRLPNKYSIRLIVTNEEACSDTISKEYDLKAYFVTPTAFSPNGDGLNDKFQPLYRGVKELLEFKVYNRWGELVYEAPTTTLTNLDKEKIPGWDGKYNNADQPSGVYVFRASGKTVYDTDINLFGKLVLIR